MKLGHLVFHRKDLARRQPHLRGNDVGGLPCAEVVGNYYVRVYNHKLTLTLQVLTPAGESKALQTFE